MGGLHSKHDHDQRFGAINFQQVYDYHKDLRSVNIQVNFVILRKNSIISQYS